MSTVATYVKAAERENTRRSYAAAIRHFEEEWKGLLPTTADATCRYLAEHAHMLAISTLRQRLAALSRWHVDHGFADPTKAPLVRQVLKGIRTVHPAVAKQARPLEIDVVEQIDQWLVDAIDNAQRSGDRLALLRHTRNRSLLLLGFWRGFRSDELVHLRVENVEISPGEGLSCYLSRTKGDRQMNGRVYRCPALSRLCPVAAFTAWIELAGLVQGPVFRGIDRWGRIGEQGLHTNSVIPLLRNLLSVAGVAATETYSSHSMRRGFAGWARASGWDIKELMEYVGWRDVKSALRYLDVSAGSLQARFEEGLAGATRQPQAQSLSIADMPEHHQDMTVHPDAAAQPVTLLRVTLSLSRFSAQSRGLTRARRLIEQTCFERYTMQRLNVERTRYELTVPYESRDALEEEIAAILDDMYRIAEDNQCLLETSIHEPATNSYWD